MELLAKTCNTEQMNAQRMFARGFVLVGGLFWIFMIWGSKWAYEGAPLNAALGNALIIAAGIAVLFVIGMFFENVAALILAVGAIGLVVFGIVSGWEVGVWATVFFFFILPMLIAAALYFLAARMQKMCSLPQ